MEVTVAFEGVSCWVPSLAPQQSAFSLSSLGGLIGLKSQKEQTNKDDMRQVSGSLWASSGAGGGSAGGGGRRQVPNAHGWDLRLCLGSRFPQALPLAAWRWKQPQNLAGTQHLLVACVSPGQLAPCCSHPR